VAIFLLVLLMVQDQESNIEIQPITPGNQVPLGSFLLTVPEGIFLAPEDNAALFYRAAGTDRVPNCVGVFFHGEDNGFIVIIQHFPFQNFILEPEVSDNVFNTLFAQNHLLMSTPYQGEVDVFMPPFRNETENTFSFGIHYFNTTSRPGYFAKKVWVSDQDALVMTLAASEASYIKHQELVEAALQSVTDNPAYEAISLTMEPRSYLGFYGITRTADDAQGNSAESAQTPTEEPVSPMIYAASAALIGGSILLLILAARMRKREAPTPEADQSS